LLAIRRHLLRRHRVLRQHQHQHLVLLQLMVP
jgi:hypothetical protein